MSNLSFTEALDQALELLEQGHPLEYCVQQFPEYADELRPLLMVSADLHSLADLSFPSFDKATIEPDWESILAQTPQQPRRRFRTYGLGLGELFHSLQYHPVQRYAVLAAAIIILCTVTWRGTTQSAANSVLYPLKRSVEQF